MIRPWMSLQELHDLLVRRGHTVEHHGHFATNVTLPPSAYITVGLDLDPMVRVTYRQNYFATYQDEVQLTPLLRDHCDFVLPERFASALFTDPGIDPEAVTDGFLAGPFRWLLRRLTRFPRWLLWPDDSLRDAYSFVHPIALVELPHLKSRLDAAGIGPPDLGAIVLERDDVSDCGVVWEAAAFVASDSENFFISDLEATEVYEIHHHDKVGVSVPDPAEREGLLEELRGWSDLFEDAAGYVMESDADCFEETEKEGPEEKS
jgi:hypothetical protein